MASNPFELWVFGDPIRDVWVKGHFIENKWFNNPEDVIVRPGGADNTIENALSIADQSSVIVKNQIDALRVHSLTRMYNMSRDATMIVWDHLGDRTKLYNPVFLDHTSSYKNYGFVISDYNKGAVNRIRRSQPLTNVKFAVIDSKYRSLHSSWLHPAENNIWRCTGDEYDPEWAKSFDYIIHTDGDKAVTVINGLSIQAETVSIPQGKPVDTIGAGDTFTAAVGIWLGNVFANAEDPDDDITFDDVVDATRFAIWCCQDVIMKQYTAICTRTLKQYLETQVVH